jgi:hypothetical protein
MEVFDPQYRKRGGKLVAIRMPTSSAMFVQIHPEK